MIEELIKPEAMMIKTTLISITLLGATLSFASEKEGVINADRDKGKFSNCKKNTGITMQQINAWWEQDRASRGGNYVYIYVPVDLLKDPIKASIARLAVFKALNQTAVVASEVYTGEDASEGHCALYAVDVSQYWGSAGRTKWGYIADPHGGSIKKPFSPAAPQNEEAFDPNLPAPADLVTLNAIYGNVYNMLIDTPDYESELRSKYGINTDIIAAGMINKAIVYGPRFYAARQTQQGLLYYWSSDNFDGVGTENDPNPLGPNERYSLKNTSQLTSWNTSAIEAILEMPNGLVLFFIWGNATQARSKAEKSFVYHPNVPGEQLQTGQCGICHMQGVQAADSDYDGEGVWTSNKKWRELYARTRDRYRVALRGIVEETCQGTEEFCESLINATYKVEPFLAMTHRRAGQGNGIPQTTFD